MRMLTPLPARLLLPAYVLVNNVLKRHIIVVFFLLYTDILQSEYN